MLFGSIKISSFQFNKWPRTNKPTLPYQLPSQLQFYFNVLDCNPIILISRNLFTFSIKLILISSNKLSLLSLFHFVMKEKRGKNNYDSSNWKIPCNIHPLLYLSQLLYFFHSFIHLHAHLLEMVIDDDEKSSEWESWKKLH